MTKYRRDFARGPREWWPKDWDGYDGRPLTMQESPKRKLERILHQSPKVARKAEQPVSFYWAYGSNLNVDAMARRCPDARKFGKLMVEDSQLVFRGVADVIYKPGAVVAGGLWKITRRDEEALDRYEGYPHLYGKKYLRIRVKGTDGVKRNHRVLYYAMKRKGIMPPSTYYVDVIAQGYADFDLDLAHLDEAVRHSWAEKDATEELQERHTRRGGKLARHDHVFEDGSIIVSNVSMKG